MRVSTAPINSNPGLWPVIIVIVIVVAIAITITGRTKSGFKNHQEEDFISGSGDSSSSGPIVWGLFGFILIIMLWIVFKKRN
jgi:LPXTG-motif cell wall-anchored protein